MSLFSCLVRLLHRHRWIDSKFNKWGIAFEQKCKCGAVRHHGLDDFNWDTLKTTWHDGPSKLALPREAAGLPQPPTISQAPASTEARA